MKCLVAIKRVVDPYVHIRVKKDGCSVETDNVKMAMNPFDEIAVEEAVRLKEAGLVKEIKVISIGMKKCQETLRQALALGADSAAHIMCEQDLTSLQVAKILRSFTENYMPEIIILGKQSIDGDNNQTGQMLAAMLGWGQATFVSKLELTAEYLIAEREVDDGLETVKMKLPVVITTDLRLNEPRYATLPNVMKAKNKPLDIIPVNDYGLNLISNLEIIKISEPITRSAGVIVASVEELVDKLKNEAKVV
ncbi:MAG: electron transfer flavoprotein subunit beta/FixA family protein [Francisellaceae bacterium]|jgi:electron transfer flavoprotein beta subunit|nr:electron transfer flavoprotein subunit beta/FixA family protein [Francisellaceae bacterium]MBT6207971.1 electron transfer flavoprotein subunit beta/FixA family protein [Francisellaceae bacterium]MBT6539890.1 electron transfer flavoprotein subunit beta/FixA family protein [Francisellaceae bacterium]